MNIAHLLPRTARFPLSKHNGRYEWALRLAKMQAAGGHQITVYSAPGSDDDSDITWKSSDYDFKDKDLNNIALIKTALQQNHDIFHSHFDFLHYFVADSTDKPILSTQHWFPDKDFGKAAEYNTRRNVYAVAPTNYMHEEDQKLDIPNKGTIYHGIDLDLFKPAQIDERKRLIFVGRITPRKGVMEAVQIALAAHEGLDIIGKVNDSDKDYWKKIEPLVDGQQINYLGPKTQAETAGLFQQAKAFIFPSQSTEAFGLVTAEAQACGTPVIIEGIGASAELVDNGKSGFVVHSKEEYIQAIKNISQIDREYCRKFAQRFDINIMSEKYYRLYEELVSR